jgi:exodeoxyribonuclease VII large subunit
MLTRMQAPPLSNIAEFTVSELSFALKRTVEDAFGLVRLRGEVSGYRGPHSSGHVYLCLKDDRARIDAIIWRGTFLGLKFKPEEGLEVIVTGRITTFPGKSSYQIVIEQLEPAGAGALMALLEERKKRFAAEGLFDEEKKRPLPFWPNAVGIVTSPTGAVIRDMLHGFAERCPTHVIVWPVRVQGETCGVEVASAIRGFNALSGRGFLPRPELLIVARGGGSLEDLWGFNEEVVVRAVAESTIPLISAVGHETDWTLIDLAADARAPTPTKAAEWAVPKHSDLTLRISECADRARRCVRRRLETLRAEFRGAERGLPRPQSLLAVPRQRVDTAGARLGQSLRHFSDRSRGRFERCAVRLAPRLISMPLERSADRLIRTGDAALRAFRLNAVKKRDCLTDRAGRLNPRLLAGPSFRLRERLQSLSSRASRGAINALKRKAFEVGSLSQLLKTLSHKSVLERGFALVRSEDGSMIRRAAALKAEAGLDIEFADGHVPAHYSGATTQEGTHSHSRRLSFAPALRRAVSVKKDDGSQGSLL